MPLYVGTTQKRRRVKLLSAGKDTYTITNVVGNTINIEAVLNDITNLRNVKIDWVQTAGETTNLSSTDTLETSYVDGDSSDKTYRIYLDRDTNREQTKDITFYKTPTSIKNNVNGVTSKIDFTLQTIPNLRFETGITFPPLQGIIIPSINIQSGYGIAFDPTSIGGLVGNATKIQVWGAVGVLSYVHPQLMVEEFAVDGVIPTFFIVPEGSYSVEIEYERGRTISYRSPTIFMEPVAVSSELMGVDDVLLINKGGVSAKTYNFKRFLFIKIEGKSTHFISGGPDLKTSNFKRFKNVNFNTVENSAFDDSVFSASKPGVGFKLYNFTRLNPSNVGSD
jgi:hypothetical protein